MYKSILWLFQVQLNHKVAAHVHTSDTKLSTLFFSCLKNLVFYKNVFLQSRSSLMTHRPTLYFFNSFCRHKHAYKYTPYVLQSAN